MNRGLTYLTLFLAAVPILAQNAVVSFDHTLPLRTRESLQADAAIKGLMLNRIQLGLGADDSFSFRNAHSDEMGQTHCHFAQYYKGVRVWGGDAITHTNVRGVELPLTNALHRNINLNVAPSLSGAEALGIVHQNQNPKGSYTYEPTAELIIYPVTSTHIVRPFGRTDQEVDATMLHEEVTRFHLAYHVQTVLLSKADNFAKYDFIVDAHTGAVLKQWDSLETTAATGTGSSQYSGNVSIQTNYTGTTYELRDMTRGTGGQFNGNAVTDMNHAGDQGTGSPSLIGTLFTDSDNIWGDGANYAGGSTTNANGQTAAVDAAYGVASTWDMYKNVFGRNGIDNTGKATFSRVHFSSYFDNAFWLDQCFCMSYGDGSTFKSLEALDVAGHELSHGVCATTAALIYSGESGGLNEANSDIFGTMTEFYVRSGGGSAIGSTGGNWTIGEQLSSTPLRYMYKPSLDGISPDAWSSTIGSLNVHYSSGPMNRCFYFLSQGATTTGNTSSSYLPSGMTGIGNDKAARIWYRALTTYLTSSSNYASARTAAISAAQDLYGAGSLEEMAVWNAFHGINVGAIAPNPTPPPTMSRLRLGSVTQSPLGGYNFNIQVTASGSGVTRVEFYIDGMFVGLGTQSGTTYTCTLYGNGAGSTVTLPITAIGYGTPYIPSGPSNSISGSIDFPYGGPTY